MTVHGASGHAEADVSAPRAALFGGHERQVHRIRHEVRVEQKPALLAGCRGAVLGVSGENGVGFQAAKALRAFGAEVAITCRPPKALMMTGALVTATKRATSRPEPLKCWCQVLSGTANSAPAFHSNVIF